MIEFSWMRYGDSRFRHLWQYDQEIGLLRSYCHSIMRNGRFQDFPLTDFSSGPKCQRCLKAKKHVVD